MFTHSFILRHFAQYPGILGVGNMPFPTVHSMLRWQLPPCCILVVLLLKFSNSVPPAQIDFMEVFAGCGALSYGLRHVSRPTYLKQVGSISRVAELGQCLFCILQECLSRPEADYCGVSMDIAYDHRTQDLTTPAGFLLLVWLVLKGDKLHMILVNKFE